ncbi:MAG: hypothetical protein K8S13_23840 [Desulfobacula sp.]|uniref:GNAT family N-acetyltransferase n=1 Tax=Desulfobacula sp. TaxID=2593537 RepID=UPI0025BF7BF9|nr:GNAT family N-acetyltransferase [Desulfobacula sp.]MCD4722862.1 hypothetical protein [Desulfobacula sp.]
MDNIHYLRKKTINKCIEIEKGKVHIESKLTVDRIQDLIFASDFTSHAHYTSIYTRRETLECFAKKGAGITLAILDNKTIVGFSVLDYPNVKERWAKLGEGIMMEIKAVEVLRGFRNHGIARQLLFPLFRDPELEKKIVYLTAYSWTWDLDYSGLSVQSYRNMLINLYAGFGLIEYLTNEPNICLKPENIFMAQVGKNVPQEIRETFKWMRFGVSF